MIDREKQRSADTLFNYSRFVLMCLWNNQLRPCEMRLHLMQEISGLAIPWMMDHGSFSDDGEDLVYDDNSEGDDADADDDDSDDDDSDEDNEDEDDEDDDDNDRDFWLRHSMEDGTYMSLSNDDYDGLCVHNHVNDYNDDDND
ncbi:prostatic spermine-binding protein-like [Impatiens glandulifera]|uniref:prostatic spermine-binding protein-like n=1 Tax=Impatiens glandulifera TaxID=253017 RepID=UPI001FB0E9CE|nr:prostatic spermine-binding protein-like [Impatiens glandulifera]